VTDVFHRGRFLASLRKAGNDGINMRIAFTKTHGLGNDFILIDCRKRRLPERRLPALAREWCDRHFGIGADGLLLLLPSRRADFGMRIINSDGSEAEMCGNGIRCFARYLHDHRLTGKRELEIETLAGIIRPRLILRAGRVQAVRVDMGEPRLERAEIPMKGRPATQMAGKRGRMIDEPLRVGGERVKVTCVSMGNPHCVTFVRNVERVPVETLGPAIENHRSFPERTNVEFVQVAARDHLVVRVWERGAAITLACGTGACASMVAGVLTGRSERKARVDLPGGRLDIEWKAADNRVYMAGPAAEVFAGEIEVSEK
jgi:diaminopimelate epimerase